MDLPSFDEVIRVEQVFLHRLTPLLAVEVAMNKEASDSGRSHKFAENRGLFVRDLTSFSQMV